MSPGSSIAIASSAVTTASVRSTAFDARASIRSLTERSMALSGQNPSVHSLKKCHQVRRNRLSEREALVELRWIEDGLDGLTVDVVGAVALDGIRHEVRGEPDHPGSRVLATLLVEAHGEPIHRLEQCRQRRPTGPAPRMCTRPPEGSVSKLVKPDCRAFASSLEPQIRRGPRMYQRRSSGVGDASRMSRSFEAETR